MLNTSNTSNCGRSKSWLKIVLRNMSWRNKTEEVNFNCHELMRLWITRCVLVTICRCHFYASSLTLLCLAPHTLFALCSEWVVRCMRMMTSFYQDLSFCDFCSFVTFFEANVRLSISPNPAWWENITWMVEDLKSHI